MYTTLPGEEPDIFEDMNSEAIAQFYNVIQDNDNIKVILTMSIGLETNLLNNDRLEKLVKEGRVQTIETLITWKVEYKNKITRRAYHLTDASAIPLPKSSYHPKCLTWLTKKSIKDEETKWLLKDIQSVMNSLDKKTIDEVITGSSMCALGKHKIRMYEAFFLNDFRDELLKRNKSLSCTELDASKFKSERVKPLFKIGCDKYNKAS